MIKYTNVISSVKPEPIKIDDFSVWIAENVQEVTVTDTEMEGEEINRKEYHYDLTQYDKTEYIQMQAEQAKTLNEQITDTELALVEIYESDIQN